MIKHLSALKDLEVPRAHSLQRYRANLNHKYMKENQLKVTLELSKCITNEHRDATCRMSRVK